jgi:hypothetical protein
VLAQDRQTVVFPSCFQGSCCLFTANPCPQYALTYGVGIMAMVMAHPPR